MSGSGEEEIDAKVEDETREKELTNLFYKFQQQNEAYKELKTKQKRGQSIFEEKPIVKNYFNEAKFRGYFDGNIKEFTKRLKLWYLSAYGEELVLKNPPKDNVGETIKADLDKFVEDYIALCVDEETHTISSIPNDYRLPNYPESVKQYIGCQYDATTKKYFYTNADKNRYVRSLCSDYLSKKCGLHTPVIKIIGLEGQCHCGANLFGIDGKCMRCDYVKPRKAKLLKLLEGKADDKIEGDEDCDEDGEEEENEDFDEDGEDGV